MTKTNGYKCPICKKGYITILAERTGAPGFRKTDYHITNKTCECITYDCENVALAIIDYNNEEFMQNETCESCDELEAIMKYPIKSWGGEYTNICSNCFKIKMEELNI
ncbi:hypothetical protein ACU5CE_32180 [Priestia megaterium]|uniref:hypothetical protein n=1 Tax=Priestia megaterium TaxID=1404 RepID=UPI00406BA9B6